MPGRRVGSVAWVGLAWLLGVRAASISNCGGPKDILQLSQLEVSPDPIPHRGQFTITVVGKLSQPFAGGILATDLDLKVLLLGQPFVDKHFENKTELELDPVVPAGDVKLVIGPTMLPPLPGQADVSGKVTITNGAGAPVACVALDLHAPLASTASLASPALAAEGDALALHDPPAPAPACPKPGDKVHDVHHTWNGTWSQLDAVVDEKVTQMLIKVSAQVFLGSFPLAVKLDVPVLYEPGIPQGQVHARYRRLPEAALPAQSNPAQGPAAPHIVGDIVVLDPAGAEITCRHIDNQPPSGAPLEDVVVV